MHPFCPSSSFPSAAASTKSLQEAARPSPTQRSSARLRATDPPLSPGLPPPTRQPKKLGKSATPERAVPGKATGHLAAAISTSTSPHKQVATHLLTTLSSPHVDKHLAAVGDFITPAVIKALNAHHAVPTETSVEPPPDTEDAACAAKDATTEDAARAAKAAADVDEAGDVSRSSSDASASAVSLNTQSRASKRLAGGAYNEQDDSDSGGDSGGDANDGPWQSDEETQPLPKKQRYLKCTTQCALKSTFCNP